MAKDKIKNYELNIYKLLPDMALEDYLKYFNSLGKNVQHKQINRLEDFEYLYYTYKNICDDRDITWFREWENFFNIQGVLRGGSITGHGVILIKTDDKNLFAIVFGRAYSLIKNFIIHQFGINMASILFDGKSIDSVSSKYFSLNKNKAITSYYGDSTFEFADNEAVDLLKADITNDDPVQKPELNELLTFVQKKATIGMDNIKLTIHKKDMEFKDIVKCCKLISIISTYKVRFPFPQMSIVKGDLVDRLDKKLLENILKESSRINLSVPFFSKDASDEYVFLNNINDIQLKVGKKVSKIIQNLDGYEIKQFLLENRDDIDSLRKVKIIIDGEPDILLKWLDEQIEFEGKTYAILNGGWYQFNQKYIENINEKVKIIEEENVVVLDTDEQYAFGEKEQQTFYSKNSVEIQNNYGSEEKAYKEYIYNYHLKKTYNFALFDRVLFNGNIEICDLYGDNKLIHCKIGKTQQLEECIRQSIYGTRFYYQNKHEVQERTNKDGLKLGNANKAVVIFLSDSQDINNFSISECKSLRLKQTFIDWVNMCRQIKFTPIIIISKFKKNK